MKLGHSRTPPTDGASHWRFPVTADVMIRAGDHQQLIDRIFDFRLRNNIDPGDIERDVSDFYCAKYPTFCHPEPRDTDPTIARMPSEPMLNRVSRWASVLVHRMPRGGYELVLDPEANRRAAICSTCPKQDAGWRGACGGCSSSTIRLLSEIKKMKTTVRDGNLGACSIGGWSNSTAIWVPSACTSITDDQRSAMPEACWRKAIL